MFESSLTFSSPPTILDQFRKHFLAKFSLHTYESWLFLIYTEQPLIDRIRSKKRKKNSPSNPILFSPAGGYVVCRAVWVVLVSPRRRRPHRGDKPIFVCVYTRPRVAVWNVFGFQRARSADATRSLFFRRAASAFVPPWTHFRNEICEIIAGPSRGAESVESHERTSIRNFGHRFFSSAEINYAIFLHHFSCSKSCFGRYFERLATRIRRERGINEIERNAWGGKIVKLRTVQCGLFVEKLING